MRIFAGLSCLFFLACATSKTAVAPPDHHSAAAPAPPPQAEKSIQISVPDEHWESVAAENLPPGAQHVLENKKMGVTIVFTVGNGTPAEAIAASRAQDLQRKKCATSAVQRYRNSSILTYTVEVGSETNEGDFLGHEMVGVYQVPGFAGGPSVLRARWGGNKEVLYYEVERDFRRILSNMTVE